MPFSARKMHFFEKNGNLTPCPAQPSADVKELFFREVILHQFLKRKNWGKLRKNVQAILTLLNLAQKVQFLEDLKKKVSESDWNQRCSSSKKSAEKCILRKSYFHHSEPNHIDAYIFVNLYLYLQKVSFLQWCKQFLSWTVHLFSSRYMGW